MSVLFSLILSKSSILWCLLYINQPTYETDTDDTHFDFDCLTARSRAGSGCKVVCSNEYTLTKRVCSYRYSEDPTLCNLVNMEPLCFPYSLLCCYCENIDIF